MTRELADFFNVSATAILTMEIQAGTIGELSPFPELVRAAQDSNLLANVGSLLDAGRKSNVKVVHCTASFRSDLRGSMTNAPLLRAMTRKPEHILENTPGSLVCKEILHQEYDLVSNRYHGVSPFTGTKLDSLLSDLGITTVVATGVSLNVAILGLAIEAVNLGYNVILPVDCVAGFPEQYAQQLIERTLSLLCFITTSKEIIDFLNTR